MSKPAAFLKLHELVICTKQFGSERVFFMTFYFHLLSGSSPAFAVTQQMTEMSLSSEEKAASGSKAQDVEPSKQQNPTHSLNNAM